MFSLDFYVQAYETNFEHKDIFLEMCIITNV